MEERVVGVEHCNLRGRRVPKKGPQNDHRENEYWPKVRSEIGER
jgi:hypothetical protein